MAQLARGTMLGLDYVCDYCCRTFTRKYNLQTHIENCHLNSTCYCEICDKTFGSPAGLQLHRSRGHNRFSQGLPECDLCGKIFTRKQNITSHMITVHLQDNKPANRCGVCLKTFTTKRNLKRHTKQVHIPGVEYPTCNECHKSFKEKHALITHIQFNHSFISKEPKCNIRCPLCDKVYTNNRNLKRHVETQHGEREEFKCDFCPKVYTSNQSLRRHTKTQHNNETHENIFQPRPDSGEVDVESHRFNHYCEFCKLGFTNEPQLRQHVKVGHSFEEFYSYCKESLSKTVKLPEKIRKKKFLFYNCEFCNNAFGTAYDLKDHMRSFHDKEYSSSICNVCFAKFFCKETMKEHKKICLPPDNVNSCSHCDKLFTDISSLEFHIRIFHPQAQIADSNISSTNLEDSDSYKCPHCERMYSMDRSLKHHIKLKHSTEEAVKCDFCDKICSNKYYLASHIKIVHNDASWSKCDYCEKQFKSKRNIRRHIEYTHLGMQRYKCVECETLFKEKRSLRKHLRTKHPDSSLFPQCHICEKRFESAKSCKIHLKLLHSFNMNTYPCDLCSVSFTSDEALKIHLSTKHLAEDEIYKCKECNLLFKGQEKFDNHNEEFHVNLPSQQSLPRCIICMKDFSTRKTLKRHIKKFHTEFNVDELATYGSKNRVFSVQCEECIKNLNDEFYSGVYQKNKHLGDFVIFKCDYCNSSYNGLEFEIHRYKQTFDVSKTKLYLSELCTAEMSEESQLDECMEPESTTVDIKLEALDEDVMLGPMSPLF